MPWWTGGKFLDQVIVRFKRDEMPEYYRYVFDSPSGEIVLADLAEECGILKSAEGLSADRMLFQAGKIHMFTHIAHRLNFLPEQLPKVKNFHDVTPEPEEDDA